MDIINSKIAELVSLAEDKIKKELEELRKKMESSVYNGIEDMYEIPELEDLKKCEITYGDGITIKRTNGNNGWNSAETNFVIACKLQEDERIIYVNFIYKYIDYRNEISAKCLTNYGRFLTSETNFMIRDIYSIQYAGGGFVSQHTNYSGEAKKKKCVELPKLHYKLPMWFFKVFLASLKEESDTLQTLNTDFYNYAGKWKEFMSKNAECKYDKLWDTMSSAIHENQDLEDTIKGLEKCNDELMNIEEELADKIKKLEEENKKLKEYEKYKTAIHEYLIKNNIPEPISVEEGIQSFQSLTMNKILIRKADYDEYSKTKQEIEEYKTFMKLKNKFVSKLGDGVPTVTKMEEDASRTWGLFGGDDDW